MSKKNTVGKTATKKVAKVEKIKVQGKPAIPKYELVSFGVKATIPTQMYGNIMPEIVIKAKNIEEAKAVLMPAIESLYSAYAERPRDGSSISFLNKASVTVEEKKVEVPKPVAKAPEIKKEEGVLAKAEAEVPKKAETAEELADELNERSPAFIKARSAVNASTSLDALNLIEEQIQKSVKLTAEDKPVLLTEVLKKRKTFA